MAGHQDARYIPRRREQDRSPRGWQDRFAIRRLVLAAVVMVVVALVTFMLTGHVRFVQPEADIAGGSFVSF
jgi:hypothetical protein